GRPAAAPRRALAVATRAAAPCRHRAVARRRPGDPCPLAPWWLACAAALAARARCWLQPPGPAHRPLLEYTTPLLRCLPPGPLPSLLAVRCCWLARWPAAQQRRHNWRAALA